MHNSFGQLSLDVELLGQILLLAIYCDCPGSLEKVAVLWSVRHLGPKKEANRRAGVLRKAFPSRTKIFKSFFLGSTFGESKKILQWGKGPTYLPQPPPKLPFMQLMRKMIMGFSDKITLSRVIFLSRISVIFNNSFAFCRKNLRCLYKGVKTLH